MADDLQVPQLGNGKDRSLAVGPFQQQPSLQHPAYPDQAPDVDFGGIGSALWRRKLTILLGLLIVVLPVTVFTLLRHKTYESSALVLVEKRGSEVASSALEMLERLGKGSLVGTEMELVTSRRVVERVVDELDLHVSVSASRPDVGTLPGFWNQVRGTAARMAGGIDPYRERRPLQLFPAFEASSNAQAGLYHVAAVDSGWYAATDIATDSTVVAFGRDFQFLGITGTVPDAFPEGGVDITVTAFAAAVQITQDGIIAEQVGQDANLIGVRCTALSAEDAHKMCESTLASYMRLRTEVQRAEAAVTATFLRQQTARIGEQLAVAEDSIEAYGRRNYVVALEDRAIAEVQEVTRLKARRDQLEAERVALAELIRDIDAGNGGTRKYRDLVSFPTFLQNIAVTELVTSLIDLENQRAGLSTRRSEANVEMVALDTRIGDIESQLRSIAGSYERALGTQIGSLDQTLSTTTRRLARIPTQQIQLARLERRASLLEDLYRMLDTRLKEAEVAEAVQLPSVRVVDVASLPLGPAAPNLKRNLGLALFFGLAYGLALAFYREMKDTRIRQHHHVQRQTGLPVLALVPRLKQPGPVMPIPVLTRAGTGNRSGKTGSGIAVFPGGRGTRKDKDKKALSRDVTFTPSEDKRVAVECFRSLGADIKFTARQLGNGGFGTVAITSAGRGEGKTLNACNLALVRAADGARTLLIDADMRGGGVARFFGLPPSGSGLSDVLAGSVDMGSVWTGNIQDSELWVLPAGTPGTQSARLLESPRFNRVIERARLQFDLIIVDTPPLNVITDAATVAAAVDAVVVVVREGVTERSSLDVTLARLKRAAGNVVGVVFNDAPLPKRYTSPYHYDLVREGGK